MCRSYRYQFSGDVRPLVAMTFVRDPAAVDAVDYLQVESTYRRRANMRAKVDAE
jgi:hypothetical protein